MIELVFSFVFAATAGAPAPAPQAQADAFILIDDVAAPSAPEAIGEPVAETESAEAAEAPAPAEEAVQEAQVCRYEIVTGSNLRRRVCRTTSQMAADREAAEREISHARRGSPVGDGT